MRVCRSPALFAAYRALPRLRVPRHPPLAFARLTTIRQAKHAHVSRVIRIACRRASRRADDEIEFTDRFAILTHCHIVCQTASRPTGAGRTNRERDRDVTRRATTEHFRAALASLPAEAGLYSSLRKG